MGFRDRRTFVQTGERTDDVEILGVAVPFCATETVILSGHG